jgi:membrane associated rhomboid family serine protease
MTLDDADLQAKLRRLETELDLPPSSPRPTEGSPPSPHRHRSSSSDDGLDRWRANALLPLQLLMIPWAQEIIDQVVFGGQWNLPLHPRSLEGIPGIFLSAISHSGFPHLIGNSIGFTVFSWLIVAKSRRDYWIVLLLGWLGGGVVSWLLGLNSVHGLSGVVYTLFGYLLWIGWLERRLVPLLISGFVLVNYSYFLWGMFPTQPMVAWWGHLFGFLIGIFAAYGVYREPHAS